MEIKSNVIKEVQEKIEKLAVPKGYSFCPVLIHTNGVSDAVLDSEYFYKIIDFKEFL